MEWKMNHFYNIIVLQSDDSARIKRFVDDFIKPPSNYLSEDGLDHPMNVLDVRNLFEKTNKLKPLRNFKTTESFEVTSYTPEQKNAQELLSLTSIMTDIEHRQDFASLDHIREGIINHYRVINDMMRKSFSQHGFFEEFNSLFDPLSDDEFASSIKRINSTIRNVNPEYTGYDFNPFNDSSEHEVFHDLTAVNDGEVPDAVISVYGYYPEYEYEQVESIWNYLEDDVGNTVGLILGFPTKYDTAREVCGAIYALTGLEVLLYSGAGNARFAQRVSTEFAEDIELKEPSFSLVQDLIDTLHLDPDYLRYFGWDEIRDEDMVDYDN